MSAPVTWLRKYRAVFNPQEGAITITAYDVSPAGMVRVVDRRDAPTKYAGWVLDRDFGTTTIEAVEKFIAEADRAIAEKQAEIAALAYKRAAAATMLDTHRAITAAP